MAASRPAACLLLGLMLHGCGEEPAPPPPETKPLARRETPPPASAAEEPPVTDLAPTPAKGEGAAQVLQTYYALIEAGKYEEAQRLREPSKREVSPGAFAANFEGYAEYHVTMGAPSEPVEGGDWLYSEVPVQPYGRMKDGTPFASSGTVTLRRKKSGGDWRIYPG